MNTIRTLPSVVSAASAVDKKPMLLAPRESNQNGQSNDNLIFQVTGSGSDIKDTNCYCVSMIALNETFMAKTTVSCCAAIMAWSAIHGPTTPRSNNSRNNSTIHDPTTFNGSNSTIPLVLFRNLPCELPSVESNFTVTLTVTLHINRSSESEYNET
jgi:hypothetical protein